MRRARAGLIAREASCAVVAFALLACDQTGTVLFSQGLGGDGAASGSTTGAGGQPPITFLDALAVGPYHACLLAGGNMVCWGAGQNGALGLGDVMDRNVPTRVDAGADWVEVAVGEHHSCGLRQGGSLWCWGANASGQLGNGMGVDALTPTFVSTQGPAIKLASTYGTTCAIFADRSLWCWGANAEGQLAQDDPFTGVGVDRPVPVRLGTDADWINVDAGQGHACGIRAGGQLYCWGRNSDGELGLGDGAPQQIRVMERVGTEDDWTEIRTGQNATCGIRAGGELWCFGSNFSGELGLGDKTQRNSPIRVGTDADWTAVTIDTFHTCGLRGGGKLYCWGRNEEGQLANGDTEMRLTPTLVSGDDTWDAVSAGRFHTCARRADGAVLCSGANGQGELGNGSFDRSNVLVPIAPVQ